MKTSIHLFLSRATIALVILWNVQCAITFLVWPDHFVSSFDLAGVPGEAAIRGVGVLFLMWNVPYAIAFWHPIRYRISHLEAIAMQTIGLLGETLIWMSLSPAQRVLRSSLLRFMAFDGAGLVLLLLALWMASSAHHTPSKRRILG